MTRCLYCKCAIIRHRTPTSWTVHKTGCPQVIPAYWKNYSEGWNDGRLDLKKTSNHPAYIIGFGNGIVSAEEAENGYDPRFDVN